ncbi:MAG: M56 family metallopeptidase [Planctomycetota bacterium]|nr:M56 family metallopeptidase [Planctomycetota bacterium]
MNSVTLNGLLGSPIVASLGRMLLHSIWQGAVAAGILAVVLRLVRRRRSAAATKLRYALCCGALLGVVVAAVITLTNFSENRAKEVAVPSAVPAMPVALLSSGVTAPATVVKPPFDYRGLMPIFVLAWAAGVLLQGILQCMGFLRIQKLRQSRTIEDTRWLQVLATVAEKLGIRRYVRLASSARIDVPVVLGVLRPMIVVPMAMLNDLSIQQAEAIIAHELAHIRRFDYAINLVQVCIETIFFYHPAIWWIAGQIRQERENCCDDIAAQLCGRLAFAGALLALEQNRSPRLAPAATGGSLLERIRRLLNVPSAPMSRSKSIIIPLVALLCVAGPLSFVKLSSVRGQNTPVTAGNPATHPSSKYSYINVNIDKEGELVVDGVVGTWDTLRNEVVKLPVGNRGKTVITVSAQTDDVPVGKYLEAEGRASELVQEFHLAYVSITGISSSVSRGNATTAPTFQPSQSNAQSTSQANTSLYDFLGQPVAPPVGLNSIYTKEGLSAAMQQAAQDANVSLKKLEIDDSEFPYLVGVVTEKGEVDKLNAAIKKMAGFAYQGSVSSDAVKAMNIIPPQAWPQADRDRIERRLNTRLQMLYYKIVAEQ